MRPIERIDNFLSKVDIGMLADRWKLTAKEHIDIEKNIDVVGKHWKKYPDQRFGQVLINLGILPDKLLIWIDEEEDILAAQGLDPEEYLFWTSIYDKEGNLLEEPITRLVKDMDTEHIVKVCEQFWDKLSPSYKKAFSNVIEKGSTIASTDTPGINRTTIQLWLPNKWFRPEAILEFDDKDYIEEKTNYEKSMGI